MLQMFDVIKKCIEMRESSSPIGRQIALYRAAKQINATAPKNEAFSYLVSNLLAVMKSKEYLELDVKDVCDLLSADTLGCRGEMDVFAAACRWVNHDVDDRLSQTTRLMCCVRFPLMNLTELHQCLEVSESPRFCEIKKLRAMILSAISYWLVKAAGNEKEAGRLTRSNRQYIFNSERLSPDVRLSEIMSAINARQNAPPLEATDSSSTSEDTADTDATSETPSSKRQFLNESAMKTCRKLQSLTREVNLRQMTTGSEGTSPMLQVMKPNDNESNSDTSKTGEEEMGDERDAENSTRKTTSYAHISRSNNERNVTSDQASGTELKSSMRDTNCTHSHRNEKGDWKSRTSGLTIHPHERCIGNEVSPPCNVHKKVATAPASCQTCECEFSGISRISEASEPRKDLLDSRLKSEGEEGSIFLIGGVERDPAVESPSDCPILSYDLEADTWSTRKTLPVHRYGHKTAYIDGYIYVVGGFENFSPVNLGKTSSRCCFWYEVLSGRWGIMAPLNNTRAYHGLGVLGNSIYAVGGVDSNNRLLASVEVYDRSRDEWVKLNADLYSPRMAMGTCSHKDQLWVAGGIVEIGRRTCSTAYVEVFDPATQRWAFAVNFLPSPRSCLSLVDCDGTLYAIGGLLSHRSGKRRSFTTLEDVLVFVNERNTWAEKASMPAPRHSMVSTTHDGLIFVMGGRQAEKPDLRFDNILTYDTRLNRWATLGGAPKHLTDYNCVLIPPKQPSRNFRERLASRADHRPCTRSTVKSMEYSDDNKSYSHGDVAMLQMHMAHLNGR
ncbi:uncharacterized protein LOC135397356 isoform X2 [Ornithodoros turicata]